MTRKRKIKAAKKKANKNFWKELNRRVNPIGPLNKKRKTPDFMAYFKSK